MTDIESPPSASGIALNAGAVGGGDGSDDGQAEPVPVSVRPPGVEALERLEKTVDLAVRMNGPVLATVMTALPSVAPVEIRTRPPARLWAMALSTRFATRRSRSLGSPSSGARWMAVSMLQSEAVGVEPGGAAGRYGRSSRGRLVRGGRVRLRCWRG